MDELEIQETLINLLSQQFDDEIKSISDLLLLSKEVDNILREEKPKLLFHLNLLMSAIEGRMKETAHSRFLWELLRLPKILESFAKRFFPDSFSISEKYQLNIPDKFRIDISLQTETDFFIFENKVNDAPEQCGQIYRYVQHALNEGYREDHIHVLYLNSVTHDAPSKYSLTKDGEEKESIPEKVHVNIISYKVEIVSWLQEIDREIPNEEIYLKSAILQYLDYLKEKFQISNRYDNMKNRIKQQINDKLFNEDMGLLEHLQVIEDTMSQLETLKSYLDELEWSDKAIRFQEWFEQLVKVYPIEMYKWERNDDWNIHIDFQYHGYNLSAVLTVDNGLLYCGIVRIDNQIPEEIQSSIHSSVQLLFPSALSTNKWPAYKETNYENGLERFLTLMKWVLVNRDQEK